MQHLTPMEAPEGVAHGAEVAIQHRIALVDDDRSVLAGMEIALQAEGFLTEAFSDARLALDAFRRDLPDLVVLDVRMPRLDGLELLRQLRRFSTVPVVFLTARDEELDEVLGLRLGADDYIRKPFSQRLLAERIRAVLRRQSMAEGVGTATAAGVQPVQVLERGPLRMDPNRHVTSWKGIGVTLTVTEFLLLQALALRPGYVKTRDQLMDVAYSDEVYVDDRTIDSHIKRLRKKMRGADPDFCAIETLYGVGYRFTID
jgi:two-component system response regulator ChvI